MNRNTKGQALIEFNIGMLLILLPLSFLMFTLFYVQEKKSECAVQTFRQARIQLLRSGRSSDVSLRCGPVTERIRLTALEDLDQDKGSLGLDDLIEEVSRLSERLSQLSQSVRESASYESWTAPKI